MATDTYSEAPKKKSGLSGCLMGCLIAFGVLVLLAVLVGWWASRNWRGFVSGIAAEGINDLVDQSNLPAAEREELKAQAKRVTDGIADGSISTQQMERILTGVFESPLVPMFLVKAVEVKYLDGSGLSEDEKAAGSVTLERYARGVVDKKIDQESIDKVLVYIADKDANGQWQLRESVSDEDLRKFLAEAKQEADAAEIPEEVEPIDPSEELKKVIDAVIGPAPTEPASPM